MIPTVILCGGKGTRLRGVLEDRPKCLAPIGNQTFLDLFTSYLNRQGIDEFVFATGYRHEQVADWLAARRRAVPGVVTGHSGAWRSREAVAAIGAVEPRTPQAPPSVAAVSLPN